LYKEVLPVVSCSEAFFILALWDSSANPWKTKAAQNEKIPPHKRGGIDREVGFGIWW
jgi:hypothetical protein